MQNWGYLRLAAKVKHESIDEMKHADAVLDRILYLEGIPNMQRLNKVNVGENVPEQLAADLQLEYDAVKRLNDGIKVVRDLGDHGTVELLEEILVSEEEHVDWIETQIELIKQLGDNALPGPAPPQGVVPIAMDAALKQRIEGLVSDHKVVLFVKGTKSFPQCGFSNSVIEVFKQLDVPFDSVNILADPDLRQGMKEFCELADLPAGLRRRRVHRRRDIVVAMYEKGELEPLVQKAVAS